MRSANGWTGLLCLRATLFCVSVFFLLGAGAAQQKAGPVTSLTQFYTLTPEQAAALLPVQIRGTVICYDKDWGQFYFHDGSAVRYFSPTLFTNKLAHGDFLELTGNTCLVDGGNGFTNLAAKKLAPRPIPPPKPMLLRDFAEHPTGWVEAVGRVRVAEATRGKLGLIIHDGARRAVVFVMGKSAEQDPLKLLGCKVLVRGINSGRIYNEAIQGPSITVPSINEVVILEQPPADRTPPKAMPIEALLERELGFWTNDPVQINGVIAAHTSGQSMLVRGVTAAIMAKTLQDTGSQLHKRVNVTGYLEVGTNGAVLEDAYFELYDKGPTLAAAPTNLSVPLANVPALTNVSSITALSTEDLARRIPVRLKGVVTFADPVLRNVFFQDNGDAIYVDYNGTNLASGDWVEVTGYADPGGFMPQVNATGVSSLGKTNLPTPLHVELDDLASGQLDCHWVHMKGIVRRVAVEETGHLLMTVTTQKGRFGARVSGAYDPKTITGWIDAEVGVVGAVSSMVNSQGQLVGIVLNVPSMPYVNRLHPELADPFDIPAMSIASVNKFDPKRLFGHRVKVVGTVTYATGEGITYVQDGNIGLRVSLQDTNEVRVGDVVEVLGFPALGETAPYLEEALVQKAMNPTTATAEITTAQAILQETGMDGRLVQLEGQLVQPVPRAARPRLVVQDGSTIFTVQLSSYCDPSKVAGLESGTVVRLRGVCNVQATDGTRPEAFRLLVAQTSDIDILRRPPWLGPNRLLMLAGLLAAVVAASLTWIRMLRRQVKAQTEVIRQKLEERREFAERLAAEKQLLATLIDHMPDHVFARDAQGRYLLANRSYVEFHGFPSAQEMPGKTLFDLFPEPLARTRSQGDIKLLSGEASMFEAEELAPDARGEKHWMHTLRVPLRDEQNRVTGLVGISRDITERKRAQAEMERMHSQLLDTSRLAGMAEVATSVLHNVGNVLNSVNVSASVVRDQLKASRIKKVGDVVGLLQKNAADLGSYLTVDAKGKQLPGYLASLAGHLETEREGMLREMESLNGNIEHIKEIVAMQQNYAKVRGVIETVSVANLIEDALRINAGAIERHGLTLNRDYDPARLPTVTLEKHKVLQILINLIRNAKYACDEAQRPDKLLTVRATNGDGRVKISIQDNGVGIPQENLLRIFNHGFTTRKKGHGFGLHSGALAAKELSGSLTAHSDGPGLGATFTLDLPADPYSA